ncbi:MAG TPA: restriction endonuclease subunit S [Rhizomicrobium sp.]
MNTSTIRFKARPGLSDLRFLKWWLDSRSFRTQITRLVTGSAQKNFGPSHLEKIEIDLPPLDEQRRIAAILDQADALRRKQRTALDELEKLGPALLRRLTDGRDDRNGRICPISEVTECLDRLRRPVKKSSRAEGTVPYYGANGLQGYIDRALFDEELVLVAEDGGHFNEPWRGVAYKIAGPAWVNNHAHILRPNHEILNIDYLHYALRNYDFGKNISGTTRSKLTQAQLNSAEIFVPPLSKQERFSQEISVIEIIRQLYVAAIVELDALFGVIQYKAFGVTTNTEGAAIAISEAAE